MEFAVIIVISGLAAIYLARTFYKFYKKIVTKKVCEGCSCACDDKSCESSPESK